MNAMQRLIDANAVARLVKRDPQLFSDDVDLRQPITQRLGWTDLAEKAAGRLPLVCNLAGVLAGEGARDIVLLGMGGSSLAALVMKAILDHPADAPRLHILDTTRPAAVSELLDTLVREHTFFLVSSKSGTTVEPLSLYAIFRQWMEETMERPAAGRHFIAITDPASALEKMRQKEVMRVALTAPANVGGRFSALTIFGLAPLTLSGVDLTQVIDEARTMERACQQSTPENPGAALAAWIADAHAGGRDKLTLVTSKRWLPFGLWVEQLVAESTGKHGTGVVPIIEHLPTRPTGFGDDRAVVVMREPGDTDLAVFASGARAEGHPVVEWTVDSPSAIGAEFVRWEYAVGLLGVLLAINPFDEPDVGAAKKMTSQVLDGTTTVPAAVADIDGVWVTYAGGLAGTAAPRDLLASLAPLGAARRTGDYLATLAYISDDETTIGLLRGALKAVSSANGIATCLETGPRYLHSTGQLHKGGPDSGLFLVITARDRADLAVPGSPFTLARLYRAQAEGDLCALAERGRRVMRLDLPGDDPAAVQKIAEALVEALG